MKYRVALFGTLVAMWLLWSGHYDPKADLLILSFGLASCLLVTWLAVKMKIVDEETQPLRLPLRLLTYIPWLFKEIIVSNIDVAKIILRPKMALTPELFEVPAIQKTDLGRVIYANSITLTPGTLSIEAEGGKVLVHALTAEAAEALRSGPMDQKVADLEDDD